MRIDTSSNTVTLAPSGGQTINGASSATIGVQYSSLYVVSDGSNWLIFASPGSFALSPDVLWIFPGTISTDQNNNLFTLVAAKAMAFLAFDVKTNVSPTGSDIIIDWLVNGIIEPSAQVTVPVGDTYASVSFALSLAPGDTLQPVVSQVGGITPGMTMVMRARGQ
jgi:hypothetical protein